MERNGTDFDGTIVSFLFLLLHFFFLFSCSLKSPMISVGSLSFLVHLAHFFLACFFFFFSVLVRRHFGLWTSHTCDVCLELRDRGSKWIRTGFHVSVVMSVCR
jgi:hypothetical protein